MLVRSTIHELSCVEHTASVQLTPCFHVLLYFLDEEVAYQRTLHAHLVHQSIFLGYLMRGGKTLVTSAGHDIHLMSLVKIPYLALFRVLS